MSMTPIGLVKGPGDKAYEYTLITGDTERTKVGEFVYYEIAVGAESRPILGKIVHRRLVRALPDAFAANAGNFAGRVGPLLLSLAPSF